MDDCGGICGKCDVCQSAGQFMAGALGAELAEARADVTDLDDRNAAERIGGSYQAHEQSQPTTHR